MARKTMEMKVLDVLLTEEEWEAKSAELARTVMEEREQDIEITKQADLAKETKKALEERLKEIRGNRNALAVAVSSRKVQRDIPCDWFYHLDSGKAVLVRRDTNEAVESRDLKPEERQLAIGEKLQEANAEQIELWEKQLAEHANVVAEQRSDDGEDVAESGTDENSED